MDNGIQAATGDPIRSPQITLYTGQEADAPVDGDGVDFDRTVDFGLLRPLSVGNRVWQNGWVVRTNQRRHVADADGALPSDLDYCVCRVHGSYDRIESTTDQYLTGAGGSVRVAVGMTYRQ